MVEILCGAGIIEAEIALALCIDAKTLRKHFRQELDVGLAKTNMNVISTLYRKASSYDPHYNACTIFWAKARCGFKETTVVETPDQKGTVLYLPDNGHGSQT